MKKIKFIKKLKQELKLLSKDDQKEIMEDYKLHIEEKLEAGKKEEIIIKDLGDPKEIAREHILELSDGKENYIRKNPKIGLFILMQIANVLVVFWIIFTVFIVLFSLFSSAVTIFITSFLVFIFRNDFSLLSEIGYFLTAIGVSVLLGNATIILFIKGLKISKQYFKWNINLIRGEIK